MPHTQSGLIKCLKQNTVHPFSLRMRLLFFPTCMKQQMQIPIVTIHDVELYFQWIPTTYTVTLDLSERETKETF